MYYIGGSVLNSILGKILKSNLKIPRPIGSKKSGYGMPSSHAQAFFFFLTILTINQHRIFKNEIHGFIICNAVLAYSIIASYWRVVTKLHTIAQSVIGAIIGTLMGYITTHYETYIFEWFTILIKSSTNNGITNYIETILIPTKLFVTITAALVICKKEIMWLLYFIMDKLTTKGNKSTKSV